MTHMREKYGFEILLAHTLSQKQIVRICHNRHREVICYVALEFEGIFLENL